MNTQMDPEIRPGGDGLYAVCFKNHNKKGLKEIEEIFQRYGNVISVRFAGPDEAGMTFIRYKEYEEAKLCLEEMRKSREFYVRVAYNKTDKNSNNQGASFRNRDNNRTNQSNGGNDNRNDNYGSKRNFNHWKDKTRDDDLAATEGATASTSEHTRNVKGSYVRKGMQHEESDKDDRSHTSNPVKFTDGEKDTRKFNEEGLDEVPDLMSPVKMKAVDLLLANLHPEASEDDVLFLLEKFRIVPLEISRIEYTGIKYKIPFCHLWMESHQDAELAEHLLHGLMLDGMKLVAVKAEVLLNES